MSNDLTSSSPVNPNAQPEDPLSKPDNTGQNRTFPDIAPDSPTSTTQKSGKFCVNLSNSRSFNITDLQFAAIEHTLRGVHDSRIAEMLGITRKTLWNWKTFNEDYRRALAEGRANLHAAVVDSLQAAARKATDALDDLLDDCNPRTRLRAVQTALRAVASLKPNLPDHQYHTPQSLRVGILTPTPAHELQIPIVTIYNPRENKTVSFNPAQPLKPQLNPVESPENPDRTT